MPEVDSDVDVRPDEKEDPAVMFARYLRAGAGNDQSDSGQGSGWGELFSRAANTPRRPIQPVATQTPAPTGEHSVTDLRTGAKMRTVDSGSTWKPINSAARGQQGDQPGGPRLSGGMADIWENLDQAPSATAQQSSTTKDLADFANSTGTANVSPIQNQGPAPVPPKASPELAQTEADLRVHAGVTPKIDPATGKTAEQYHEGTGGRVGRAFLDAASGFLHGGIGGAADRTLKGAFGDPNAPGYYGRGAVNRAYAQDERARQQAVAADEEKIKSLGREDTTAQRDWRNQDAAYKDDTRAAYEKTQAAENQRHHEETEGMTQQQRDTQQQLADVKQQLADAKYPETRARAEIEARRSIAKDFPRLKGQALDDYIMFGDKAAMIGIDRIRIRQTEERLGIERDRNNRSKKEVNDTGYTADEMRGINLNAPGVLVNLKTLNQKRAENLQLRMDTSKLDSEIAAQQKRLDDAVTKVRGGRTAHQDNPANNPRGVVNPATGKPFTHVATNKQTGESQGSDDGKNWVPIKSGMTPIKDTSMKTPGGRVIKIGDKAPNGQTVKGFAKNYDGKVYATF